MKLIYDEKDRLSEILGSGENGSFKEGENGILYKLLQWFN